MKLREVDLAFAKELLDRRAASDSVVDAILEQVLREEYADIIGTLKRGERARRGEYGKGAKSDV